MRGSANVVDQGAPLDSPACELCDEIHEGLGPSSLSAVLEGEGLSTRLVAESANFVALPSLGHIIEGYTLICPRSHCLSFGEYIAEYGHVTELEQFVEGVRSYLTTEFGAPTQVFEHGAAIAGGSMGCGVNHAHLHIVPVEGELLAYGRQLIGEWHDCPSLGSLADHAQVEGGYLYYQAGGAAAVCCPTEPPPPQYFRRALAMMVGQPDDWDWRLHPHNQRLGTALKRYRGMPVQLVGAREA